jgi:hydroxylaminobenzene mutase
LSEGHVGKPWQERVVGLGFKSMRYAFLTSVVLVLVGLARRRAAQDIAAESPAESHDSALASVQ